MPQRLFSCGIMPLPKQLTQGRLLRGHSHQGPLPLQVDRLAQAVMPFLVVGIA